MGTTTVPIQELMNTLTPDVCFRLGEAVASGKDNKNLTELLSGIIVGCRNRPRSQVTVRLIEATQQLLAESRGDINGGHKRYHNDSPPEQMQG